MIKRNFPTQAACAVPQMPEVLNWQGIFCVREDDGSVCRKVAIAKPVADGLSSSTYSSYTPFTKDLGYYDEAGSARLFQVYKSFNSDNFKKLRGGQTQEYAIDLIDVVKASNGCAAKTVQASLDTTLYAKAPGWDSLPSRNGTSVMNVWPDSFTDTTAVEIPVNALSETCHWNIPIVTMDAKWLTYCTAAAEVEYTVDRGNKDGKGLWKSQCNIAWWNNEGKCNTMNGFGCWKFA